MKAYAGKDTENYFEICPYCLENACKRDEICDRCAIELGIEEDRKEIINSCGGNL